VGKRESPLYSGFLQWFLLQRLAVILAVLSLIWLPYSGITDDSSLTGCYTVPISKLVADVLIDPSVFIFRSRSPGGRRCSATLWKTSVCIILFVLSCTWLAGCAFDARSHTPLRHCLDRIHCTHARTHTHTQSRQLSQIVRRPSGAAPLC
jgi:hypothetical protein